MFDPHSPFRPLGQAKGGQPQAAPKAAVALSRLHEAILGCELAPGEKINEQATAERFGLGRAAMRSALARLEGMRLVEAMPRSGWRVRPIRPQAIRDLIEARRQTEPLLVTRPLPAAALATLERQASVISALLGQDDPYARDTGRSYDRQFLDTLAGNGNLWAARWLRDAWDECSRVTVFLENGSPQRLPLADRAPLIDALRAGDTAAAERALVAPIDRFAAFVADGLMSLKIELAPATRRRAPKPPSPPRTVQPEEGANATTDREPRHEDPA